MFHDAMIWPFFFLFWPFHGLFWLVIVLVALSIVFRRRHYYYYGHPWGWSGGNSRSGALAILEERYAKGEITREDYLRMKQDLNG
ncbi:MAG TPA: SHOCT domain-containing protein [Rhizomicrobium sp.]|nr:SHOCT domain-containing protein [Rhizomicrobium sp.]